MHNQLIIGITGGSREVVVAFMIVSTQCRLRYVEILISHHHHHHLINPIQFSALR